MISFVSSCLCVYPFLRVETQRHEDTKKKRIASAQKYYSLSRNSSVISVYSVVNQALEDVTKPFS